ncbi:MAG: YIP1 family protein [Candidatus Marinimicrobia bacterium]|nr:YIP1 family protein [Candidatus Neomarinimicrobiota bacterium]
MNEQAEKKELSLVSKVISAIWSPSKTFESVSKKANWWDIIIPILLITIAAWITIPYISPIGTDMAKERIEKSERLSDTQKEDAIERIEGQNKAIQYVMTPVSTFIMILIVGLVMWLAGNFFLGGDRKFVPVFAMTSYTFLINILATIVKTPLMVSKHSVKVYTGLASILPESQTFLFRLAKHFDIFAIWKVILLGIGLGVLYKSKQSKAITVVFVIWLAYAIIASAVGGFSPF